MSRFYMVMDGGRSNSERITRRAFGGAYAKVAGWKGAVTTVPYDKDGEDYVRITLGPWENSGGDTTVIYDGPLKA